METRTEYSLAKWAKALGVSRSGYYTWKAEHKERERRHKARETLIKEVFKSGEGHYGAECICGIIRERGQSISFPVVRRIMRQNGLESSHNRRRQRSLTDSRKARDDTYLNLVRGQDIDQSMQVLSSDITYIRTAEGFDYLCTIKDIKTGLIVGFHQQKRMTRDIVLKAIDEARNSGLITGKPFFHSDRGSQYTAREVRNTLKALGWKQSFSRVGKPGDNAWSESFFANLKKEIVHWRSYPTREAARSAIFEYIHVYYNRRRVQARLGYISPMQAYRNENANRLQSVA